MNKTEFIKKVAKKSGHKTQVCNEVFFAISETIQETLWEGINIKISNFLTFTLETQKARTFSNPRTGEKIEVPKRFRVKVQLPRPFIDKMKTKKVY